MKLALHKNSFGFDRFLAKSCTFLSLDKKGGNSEGISPTLYVESWYGHGGGKRQGSSVVRQVVGCEVVPA